MKLNLVSLGCARNLVDSEIMLGRLREKGWAITDDPADAEVIIVNTCSFIEPAVNESIDTIFELAEYKQNGACKRLIVTGCLPQRFGQEIVKTLPEVDVFLGTGAFDKIIEAAGGSLSSDDSDDSNCLLPNPDLLPLQGQNIPRVQSSSYMAYLKIAEGCSKHCTYCIIPKLRGKQKSRLSADIIAEARHLNFSGIKELVLIAQDTTSYGKDLRQGSDFTQLLTSLSDISEPNRFYSGKAGYADDLWIRALYMHPESIEDSVIKAVAENENICSYFDIPVQHAANKVLRRMGRNYTREDLHRLIDKIRLRITDAAIRTTVIVGFPGETDKDFESLLSFVEDMRFDHLGLFIYSDFKDLPSHELTDHIPGHVANMRRDRLMTIQAEISLENNLKYAGRTIKVLVEEALEENLFSGRAFFQAPDVDGITYIKTGKLHSGPSIGSFADVKIIETMEYDLTGEAV
ncbi:MAG: 30S ribosomal protein S12 methylthiotransferase RimO [Thermodesulfobacteriota bacterium]|nr:30S ribosomal protein S12 methylthiotransferase RimO [Thermodesulfobacteriota bacterium]